MPEWGANNTKKWTVPASFPLIYDTVPSNLIWHKCKIWFDISIKFAFDFSKNLIENSNKNKAKFYTYVKSNFTLKEHNDSWTN